MKKNENKNVFYRANSCKVTPITGLKIVLHSESGDLGKKKIEKPVKKLCKNCKHWTKGEGKGDWDEMYGSCYELRGAVHAFMPFTGAPKEILDKLVDYDDEPILSTQDIFGCNLFKLKRNKK